MGVDRFATPQAQIYEGTRASGADLVGPAATDGGRGLRACSLVARDIAEPRRGDPGEIAKPLYEAMGIAGLDRAAQMAWRSNMPARPYAYMRYGSRQPCWMWLKWRVAQKLLAKG